MSRRGFAMPMVISLVLVVGLMTAVIVERQSAQSRVVNMQMTWYGEHHARLGLQEAIEAWIRVLPSRTDLAAVLPSDGHFLDLQLDDGTTATVYFEERQNSILTDLAAVELAVQADAAAVIELAAVVFGEEGPPDGLRTVGPAAVSAHTASEATLMVVAEAIMGDSGAAQQFVRRLIADREDNGGRASANAIGLAAQDAGVEADVRVRLTRMITVRPTLFYAVIELRDSTVGPAQSAYGGFFTVGSIGAAVSGTASPTRSTFLTWERVAVE